MMRPKRSVEIPPTNPAGAPKRAMPQEMLRHDPPATGTAASRPSTDLTGKKSTSASPQLSSMALAFRLSCGDRCGPLHHIAALPVELSHQPVNPPLGPVELRHSGRLRFG